MENATRISRIEDAVRQVLGPDILRSVESSPATNSDGVQVIESRITYASESPLSVSQMMQVEDAIWGVDPDEAAPIPVVIFRADKDVEHIAAE
jgi:hypothetical protein